VSGLSSKTANPPTTKMVPTCITVHCLLTPNGKPVDPMVVHEWHKSRGWDQAGYHFIIQPSGRVEEGFPLRKINQEGAHVKKANTHLGGLNTGIALAGTDKYTRLQLAALHELTHKILRRYSLEIHQVYCHSEFPSARKQKKSCPNIRPVDLVVWLDDASCSSMEKYVLTEKNV